MHAEVVDVLLEKGKFPPEQALALAEATDMTLEKAQLVTVPVLDARFEVVNARFKAIDAQFEAVNAQFGAVKARIDALEVKLEAKIERWAIRMIIVMIASQTALGPVGMSAIEALRRALSAFLR